MRLEGKTYMEIMNAGGGIHATTRATQQATFDEIYEQSRNRLDKCYSMELRRSRQKVDTD